MGKGAKKKGYIKNKDSGEIKKFLFNPSGYDYSRSSNFNSISAPGSSYPKLQFVNGGESDLTVDVFLHSHVSGEVDSFIKFIDELLPPETSGKMFDPPPVALFVLGKFVKPCVVTNYSINPSMFDDSLGVVTTSLNLSLKVVG